MPIKPRKQEELPKGTDFVKSIKLSAAGDYICEIIDTRLNLANERFNESYYIDFKVLSGPKDVGAEACVCKYPDDAKGGKNKKTGQVFSSKQAQQKDKDRVQQWSAACLGLEWEQAGVFSEDDPEYTAEYGAAWDQMWSGEDAETRVKGSSPVAGNKILVRCKSNGKKSEEEKFYSEVLPFKEGATASAPKTSAPAAPATKKAPPPPPPKKAEKPSFESAAETAGYQPYPGMEDQYMVRYENGEAVESVEIADVKAKLGY